MKDENTYFKYFYMKSRKFQITSLIYHKFRKLFVTRISMENLVKIINFNFEGVSKTH